LGAANPCYCGSNSKPDRHKRENANESEATKGHRARDRTGKSLRDDKSWLNIEQAGVITYETNIDLDAASANNIHENCGCAA